MADTEIDPEVDLDPQEEDTQTEGEDNEPEAEEIEASETDDEGEETDEEVEQAPELIDWDLGDGKTVNVPASVKDHLLRQADYTRKTQAVAERERELESERESLTGFGKLSKEMQANVGRLASVDEQLAKFARGANGQMVSVDDIDWVTWQQTNPQEAAKAVQRAQTLQQQRASLQRNVEEGQKKYESETKQQAAKRLQETRAFAEKEIPNWSPDREKQLADTVISKLSDRAKQLLGDNIDPSLLSVLDAALDGYRYREARATKAKRAMVKQKDNVTPLKTVAQRRGGGSGSELSDKLSTAEWIARRQKQLNAKAG